VTVTAVSNSICDVLGLCLVSATPATNKLFGFAEFVQAFALLVLVYTMADVRYRFRAATAPVPIWAITFWFSALIGFGTLLTDLWFLNGFPIFTFLANQTYWQFVFGLLFIGTVLLWLWYAYLQPPSFGRRNGERFTRQLYLYVLQGAESEMPVIASELRRSAWNIVKHATLTPHRLPPGMKGPEQPQPTKLNECANSILLIIGSRKFCRHIVESAPITAIAFFQSMSEQKKYRLPIGQFAANVSSEALQNKDSILYHEDEGYYSGYLGYTRPFTNAIYGDFYLVEALTEGNSPLDVDLQIRREFDAQQLKAYCRAVITTFTSALQKHQFYNHSYALYRAIGTIERSCSDLYRLNDAPPPSDADDIHGRLNAAIEFVNDAIDVLEKNGVFHTKLRRLDEQHNWRTDYYDHLAHLAFELIGAASSVKSKEFVTWTVQHNAIWSRLFNFDDSKTRRIVLFKLRRLLFEEIKSIEQFPHFRNAAYLGYCLNVLGLDLGPRKDHRRRDMYPFRHAVLSWARKNYLWMVKRQPKAAAAAMIGPLSFDSKNKRIVKTYDEGLNRKAPKAFLALDDTKLKKEFPPKLRKQKMQ
jgi:hypothetical protein